MIIGDQIRFRGIEKEDLPHFVRWLNDPEVRQGLSLRYPLSLAEEEEWFAAMIKRPPQERPLAIEIQPDSHKDVWVFVGNCGFINTNWENRNAEIGVHIGEKRYWDQGFGTKAMRLILKHGFDSLNFHRIYLRVFETNQRAIRSYQKAGFTLEGKMREAQYLNGRYVDVLFMSILQHEWQLETERKAS
ncbi:MAG TPA: N-acetyltransferase [Chloroflexi bacterium]|nr:MAG: N-acetyltransferase [Chloroflexota bacterium]HDD56001.1 N-acetyltransferase [Chloroflexota bacterium]